MLTAVLPYLSLLGLAVLGLLVSVIFSLIPALHIYNVAGFALIIYAANPELFDGQQLAMFMLGMVVGYAMLNTLPAIFLSAPDDSMAFAVLPAQQFLLNGRGFEAVVLVGLGSLGGVFVLLLISPFIAPLLSPMRVLMGPHLHWILGVICVYMILSEWPFSTGEGSEMVRFRKAWSQLLAGALTFLLSGIIGFIVFNRSFVPLEKSYQNLLPAFTGFFAVPALLHTILFGKRPPKQTVSDHLNLTYDLLWRGVVSGAMGGLFAAFVPVVTAGIGGLMAGHATAQRDERIFIISQGASKFLYFVGAYLLFFVPGFNLQRGGLASMVGTIHRAVTPAEYQLSLAILAITGGLSFLILIVLARFFAKHIHKFDHRMIAGLSLFVVLLVVGGVTGGGGLLVMLVCTPVGLIPIFWKTRRMHCLAVLMLPITLNMAGLSDPILRLLGLM